MLYKLVSAISPASTTRCPQILPPQWHRSDSDIITSGQILERFTCRANQGYCISWQEKANLESSRETGEVGEGGTQRWLEQGMLWGHAIGANPVGPTLNPMAAILTTVGGMPDSWVLETPQALHNEWLYISSSLSPSVSPVTTASKGMTGVV